MGFGIVVLLGLPLVFAGFNVYSQMRYGALNLGWADMLVLTSNFGMAIQLLTVAMLGGSAIAAERADRSAEFLAYLPPSRRLVWASKVCVALGACVFLWCATVIAGGWVASLVGTVSEEMTIFRGKFLLNLTAAAVILFGAAWCASAFLSSHALATGLGIVAPIALLLGLASVQYLVGYDTVDLAAWYRVLGVTLGIVFFVAGSTCYLRRVEP